MTNYPNLIIEPELLTMKTRDDAIEFSKYQAENHYHENLLKSLKIDNEYYKKKYKSPNKKRVFKNISEILIGSVGLGSGLTISGPAAVGIMTASSISFISSISTFITSEYFSKIKRRYTKLRDWINVITLSDEKTLKQSMIDKKIDRKEALELKKNDNHYLDKRKEIMKNTEFKVEDVFGDVISKDSVPLEQITKLKVF